MVLANTVSATGPVGGWNTRDAIDSMPAEDAIQLDNVFPGVGKVSVRGGYEDYCVSGIGSDNVETMCSLKSGATELFIVATDNKWWEITSPGSPADRTGAATITLDQWQTTVFADSSAPTTPTLLMVNGTDAPLKWTGSGNVANWVPTGPTIANLIGIHSFKNRVYVWEKFSRDFWYGDPNVIPGALTRFPLSGIRGAQGNLLFMETWTRDGGAGPDDYAVFVTDAGWCIIYAGYWPGGGDATWSLVGVYQIARPLSIRAHAQVLGDVLIATDTDYVLLSEAIQQAGVVTQASKLAGAIRTAAAAYRTNYGWELCVYPRGNYVLSNIPLQANTQYEQHIINIQTRAACKYTGWNFRTYCVFGGNLYGSTSGKVYRLEIGRSDDSSNTATAIKARVKTAFNDLGAPGKLKHVTAIRPLLRVSGTLTAGWRLVTDFQDVDAPIVASTGSAATLPVWDTAAWDTAYWSLEATAITIRTWKTYAGRGTHFSVEMSCDIKNQALEWLSTDYLGDMAARV
jgi:hypothetical protein